MQGWQLSPIFFQVPLHYLCMYFVMQVHLKINEF